MSMKFVTRIVIAFLTTAFWGYQAEATDTSGMYAGHPLDLGFTQTHYGASNYHQNSSWLNLGFWAEAGLYLNFHGNSLKKNGGGGHLPAQRYYYASGNTAFLGNLHSTNINLNQVGVFLEKKLADNGFNWGFKTQMLFGTDAYLTQSYSDSSMKHLSRTGDYYLSFSDLYLTLGNNNLGVRIGKFVSPLSYEHVESPNNFFYSHSYGFLQAPNTHTGLMLDYQPDHYISFFAGVTTGSDSGWSNRFGDSACLAGIRYKPWDDAALSYAFQYERIHGGFHKQEPHYTKHHGYLFDGEDLNAYYHSVVFTQKFEDWNYAAEWYLLKTLNHSDDLVLWGYKPFSCYGISQYLTYQMNSKLGVGVRAEWRRETLGRYNNLELTFGTNWTPRQHLVVRPEIRCDWLCGKGSWGYRYRFFNNGKSSEQFTFGVAVMYKY